MAALDERARGGTFNVEDGMDLDVDRFVSHMAPDEARLPIPRWALNAIQFAGATVYAGCADGVACARIAHPGTLLRARFSSAHIKPSRLQTDLGCARPPSPLARH